MRVCIFSKKATLECPSVLKSFFGWNIGFTASIQDKGLKYLVKMHLMNNYLYYFFYPSMLLMDVLVPVPVELYVL